MSNGFIYVVDAHFNDKIEEEQIRWTQVPVTGGEQDREISDTRG
jgi:hypothetical protein